jgi:hypothetical protein
MQATRTLAAVFRPGADARLVWQVPGAGHVGRFRALTLDVMLQT